MGNVHDTPSQLSAKNFHDKTTDIRLHCATVERDKLSIFDLIDRLEAQPRVSSFVLAIGLEMNTGRRDKKPTPFQFDASVRPADPPRKAEPMPSNMSRSSAGEWTGKVSARAVISPISPGRGCCPKPLAKKIANLWSANGCCCLPRVPLYKNSNICFASAAAVVARCSQSSGSLQS